MFNKRGISPVVAVVLLIMITVVAAGIIVAFVVPFVRDVGDQGKECFEVTTKLGLEKTGFNCYVSDGVNVANDRTGFSIEVGDERIVEVSVSLLAGGDAKNVRIKDGATDPDLRMLNAPGNAFGDALVLPGEGETKTYVIMGQYEKIEVAPILESGNACDPIDEITIEACDVTSTAYGLIGSP